MKLKTNPDSRAYCYAFVEGLTVTVVIDQTSILRTIRVTTNHTPDIDARPFVVTVDGHPVESEIERLDAS